MTLALVFRALVPGRGGNNGKPGYLSGTFLALETPTGAVGRQNTQAPFPVALDTLAGVVRK